MPQSYGSTVSIVAPPGGTRSLSAYAQGLDQTDSTKSQKSSTKPPLETVPTSSGLLDTFVSLINVAAQSGWDEGISNPTENAPKAQESVSRTILLPHHSDLDFAALKTSESVSYISPYNDDGTHASKINPGALNPGSLSMLLPSTALDTYRDAPLSTLGGSQSATIPNSEYFIGGQTVKPGGPAVTLSGTVVSLVSGATAVVIDSSTSSLTTPLAIGSYILAGIGGAAPITGESETSAFHSTEGLPSEPTNTPEVSSSHSGGTAITHASSDEAATGQVPGRGASTPARETTHSDSTTTTSTHSTTEQTGGSSRASNGFTSEAGSDASSTTAPQSGDTSFAQRGVGSPNTAPQKMFLIGMLALWLSLP